MFVLSQYGTTDFPPRSMERLTEQQEKYLARKLDIITANIAGVGFAAYMLADQKLPWNNAARDRAFKETEKVLRQIALYFSKV